MAFLLRGGPCDGEKIIYCDGLHFVTDNNKRIMIKPWQEIEESPELMGDIGVML